MESSRWKKASLAINTIIRGLELDQIAFRYDETAFREMESLAGDMAMRGDDRVEPTRYRDAAL
jgi:hypothetical protein